MLTAFLVSFGVIFVAELGDKSQLMALAFGTRYPAIRVLIGVTVATGIGMLCRNPVLAAWSPPMPWPSWSDASSAPDGPNERGHRLPRIRHSPARGSPIAGTHGQRPSVSPSTTFV